jgi:uncharacterized repeat protein (TIGR03803 family)
LANATNATLTLANVEPNQAGDYTVVITNSSGSVTSSVAVLTVITETFTTLHSFMGSDGANPYAGVTLSGNTLYGTTYAGGSSGEGTVFRVNTDGTDFTNLHNFTYGDGAEPLAGVILSDTTLYGTTFVGGSSGFGTVFSVNIDGSGFTNLYVFTNGTDGANSRAGLLSLGNTLYGTAFGGGNLGAGTVFKINTDGTGFTNLYSFKAGNLINSTSDFYTNSDGANPTAGLILSGNTLYGTTRGGNSSGNGTVFAVNTDGTDFTNLHNFTYGDGSFPYAGVILSGNALYGTTTYGGSSGGGTIFKVNTDHCRG